MNSAIIFVSNKDYEIKHKLSGKGGVYVKVVRNIDREMILLRE